MKNTTPPTYEEFLDDPHCRECNESMELIDGCEWPEDPELWRCAGCVSLLAGRLLEQNRIHRANWKNLPQAPPPDPIPDLIAEILQMEGMHPDTRRLIELAIEAQRSGALPAFIPAKARQLGMCPFPPTPNVEVTRGEVDARSQQGG